MGLDENAPNPFHPDDGEDRPSTDSYHLRVTAAGSEYVSLQLIKTQMPPPPIERAIISAAVVVATGKQPDLDRLAPKLLGTFQFWYTGEDTFEGSDVAFSL